MKHRVYKVALANGIQGLLIDISDASVMTFEFNFRAGEYLVPLIKWETPHLMEHLLLGANELLPKARLFHSEFEKNGADCNASTGSYDITYESECADFEWDRILDLLLNAITKPLFLEEEFKAEFGNVSEELALRSNNHFRYLSLALRRAYGFKVLTDQQRLVLIDNVNLADVRQHYQATHGTANLRFVIAGKLPPTRRRLIRGLLADLELPRGKRLELPKEVPSALTEPLYLHNESVDNLYFYIDTFIKRRLSEPELDALGLVNTMLTETLYSRILGTARERGLVYDMNSGYGQSLASSNWWFGAQVMPKNAPALFDVIVNELSALFKGQVAEDDLAAAKQYALGRYQRSAQTVGGTAAGYSGRYFFDGVIEDYYQVPDRIRAVSRQQMVSVASEMFGQAIWGLGVLGSAGIDFVARLKDRLGPLW